ncbi:hypothetical protein J437_LFUL015014 [Ladona fulva]|uniref:Uncharacterized protein n=1 Tax=Ladona fulva TaxID=123851 RepID=A0A8K0P860_LADFU|nr:hypothetical protein J437_LFUL015014 [Ladona fulva]
MEKNNLKHKLIAYSADNTNANFGGKARRGTNNIFYKLNENLNQNIIGVGCAAHIIHNAIQTGADLLPVDVENIDKCPRILEEFFEKESSKFWLEFIHNQAAIFQNAIKVIEGDNISVIEVANEVKNFKFQCQERLENNFLPLTIRNSISQLEIQGATNRADIMNHVKKFYRTNAATERVFSTVNKVWTSEESKLSVETLKAILCVKYNLTNSREKFHDLLNNDSNLLKKIHSNKKYAKE